MTEPVSFSSRSGAPVSGAIALPAGDGPAPAVVLLQEYWGLNDHVRSLADRLAAAGFIAIAPDLYHGQIAADAADAHRLMTELKWSTALDEVGGAVDLLKAHPRSNGKVGVTGFCMGGAGALAAACNVAGVSAVVAFYGLPPAQYVDWAKAETPPIQCHFSATDPWAKPALAEAIRDTLVARGRAMALFVYDAPHAFMNDTRPEVYSPDNAKLAWGRMADFFHAHLG